MLSEIVKNRGLKGFTMVGTKVAFIVCKSH